MFERHQGGDKAVLVHVDFPPQSPHDASREDCDEFVELVRSAGLTTLELITTRRDRPDPKTFIGEGKVADLKDAVTLHEAPLVLFNHRLTPGQERNLEQILGCRVIDRVGLILDIFAQRAQTHEGKLQVELAQLKHLSTRLIRGWTHLERQKGGIGLRGPGETQLETDRRLIRDRMRWIESRLHKVEKQRQQGRKSRQRAALPTVALVGYTNAGKSTLFNRLTQAGVYQADQLFATLDPTLRRVEWPETGPLVLADTVGFIRHLPHDLVAAFKATLEETRDAQLLLHVIDASDPRRDDNIEQVEQVLRDIGADDVPCLRVYNKTDRLTDASPGLRTEGQHQASVWISAKTGAGMQELREAIVLGLGDQVVSLKLRLPPEAGRIRALLYQQNMVLVEKDLPEGGCEVDVRSSKVTWERFVRQSGIDLSGLIA